MNIWNEIKNEIDTMKRACETKNYSLLRSLNWDVYNLLKKIKEEEENEKAKNALP